MLSSKLAIASASPDLTSLGVTPTVSIPASIKMSIIANNPATPGWPWASGANALGGTGGEGSIPDIARTSKKTTSPDTNDSGNAAALGKAGGRVSLTHWSIGW